jgi:hypothetical protein
MQPNGVGFPIGTAVTNPRSHRCASTDIHLYSDRDRDGQVQTEAFLGPIHNARSLRPGAAI